MVGIASLVKGLISPITGLYANHQENKAKKQEAKDTVQRILTEASAADGQIAGQIALVNAQNSGNTLKDEYALFVITFPFVVIVIAAVAAVFGAPVDVGALATSMFEPMKLIPEWWANTFQMAIWAALGITGVNKLKNG